MAETTTIPVFEPYLGPEVHKAVDDALDAGWLGMGPLTARFEEELSAWLELGDRRLVSTSSCTAAIHLACVLAGIGPGDEVICPSFTYVAGHQAVTMTGADVVFCDIEPDSYGIDPAAAEALIGERTKAIMAVHYAGPACRIDEVNALARRHSLRVVEDAAHAFGTRAGGQPIGSFGDLTAFSFGPVKAITSLEGGALVVPDESDVQTVHELRILGIDSDTAARYRRGRSWEYDVVRQGYRYHLGSIPAAIGLAQLAMADELIENRRRYCRYYNERLAGIEGLTLPATDFVDVSPFIYFVLVPDADARPRFMEHLAARGVATGIHFLGAHELSFYEQARRGDLRVTEDVARRQVTIPLHPVMSEETLDRVAGAIESFFA